MEADDGTGAFHYNTTMDSVIPSHTNGLPAGAQGSRMIHQGYDTMSGQQVADERSDIYSNAFQRNNQMQDDLYGLLSDQTVQNNFASSTAETAEVYQQHENVRNEQYMTNDPNMEAYMMEHGHNQYDEYDPSQYSEEQYVNDQFDVTTSQMENNQTASNIARTSTETLH